jgi:hypothetical protein
MRRLDDKGAVTEGGRKVALSKDYYELVLTSNSISKRVKPPYLCSSVRIGGGWFSVIVTSWVEVAAIAFLRPSPERYTVFSRPQRDLGEVKMEMIQWRLDSDVADHKAGRKNGTPRRGRTRLTRLKAIDY